MTITERELELENMLINREITWEEWSDLWFEAQMDEKRYPK